jgi:hypothetical protein
MNTRFLINPSSLKTLFYVSGLLLCGLLLTSCSTAYYSAWEKLGYEKRDLLKSTISKARQDEVETVEQFKDALEALQVAYGAPQSDLQKFYSRLKSEYEASERQAGQLNARITKMHAISGDLFREWKTEADTMQNETLRSKSLNQRNTTMMRYDQLRSAIQRSRSQMNPVLAQMKEYVLFLKHNLNAQSIGSLKDEAREIQAGMESLTQSMSGSIAEMDSFLKHLEPSDG